jgi:hypothetical protein
MRSFVVLVVTGTVAGLGIGYLPRATSAADKVVRVDMEWKVTSTEKADNDRWKEAPKNGVISGPEAWTKLWKAWHGDQEAPKVDFDKELILVVAGPGPNRIKVGELKLTEKGDLQLNSTITERGGDGFVAVILKVNRAGVRSVNGKPLPSL